MKLAIISDTHLGAAECLLVTKDKDTDTMTKREPLDILIHEIITYFEPDLEYLNNRDYEPILDYLVLAGDILDFSVATYQDVFAAAQVFFQELKNVKLAKEIIYLPGNHDADIWYTVEYQTNIINRIDPPPQQGGTKPAPKPVQKFRHSVPGVIDCRAAVPVLTLKDVRLKPPPNPRYAGLFLDNITTPKSLFNFANPNLYIVTEHENVMISHGQYVESYWAFGSEFAPAIAARDLCVTPQLKVKEIVELNFPLSQLACSGIGQAGCLSDVARKVQIEVKKKDLERLRKYLEKAGLWASNRLPFERFEFAQRFIAKQLFKLAKCKILKILNENDPTRFNKNCWNEEEVNARTEALYKASESEIEEYNKLPFVSPLPPPTHLIFGHTHIPISWKEANPPHLKSLKTKNGNPINIYNTGGWIWEFNGGQPKFHGADVFTYSPDKGIKSISIRQGANGRFLID